MRKLSFYVSKRERSIVLRKFYAKFNCISFYIYLIDFVISFYFHFIFCNKQSTYPIFYNSYYSNIIIYFCFKIHDKIIYLIMDDDHNFMFKS